MEVNIQKIPDQIFENELSSLINIHRGQDIDSNAYYGLRQLMEVAVKALSPGINDPGTAVLSLQSLGDLLMFRLCNFPLTSIKDRNDVLRIFTKERTFEEIFTDCIYPIWDYGKEDRLILKELVHILTQLQAQSPESIVKDLLELVKKNTTNLDLETT